MKVSYFILLFLLAYKPSNSQTLYNDSTLQSNAVNQGSAMAKLLLNKDYKGFTAYSYEPILKMAGGLDKMAAYMETSFKEMENEGFTITTITVDNCSRIIHLEKQLQCTLTETIEMKNADGILIQKSTLIGLSNNKGITWKFIDSHGSTLKILQKTIKELSNELVIPEQSEPTIIPN